MLLRYIYYLNCKSGLFVTRACIVWIVKNSILYIILLLCCHMYTILLLRFISNSSCKCWLFVTRASTAGLSIVVGTIINRNFIFLSCYNILLLRLTQIDFIHIFELQILAVSDIRFYENDCLNYRRYVILLYCYVILLLRFKINFECKIDIYSETIRFFSMARWTQIERLSSCLHCHCWSRLSAEHFQVWVVVLQHTTSNSHIQSAYRH